MEVIRRNGLKHGPIRAAVYIFDDPEVIVSELIDRQWLVEMERERKLK